MSRAMGKLKALGMGYDRYTLVDTDNGDRTVYPGDVVRNLVPFEEQ